MYKLVYNKPAVPILLALAGAVISAALGYIPIPVMPIPLFILLAVVPVYFIVAVLVYSRADVKQYGIVAGIMSALYIISMIIVIVVGMVTGLFELSGINLSINPVSLVLPIILCGVAGKMLVSLEQEKVVETEREMIVTPKESQMKVEPPQPVQQEAVKVEQEPEKEEPQQEVVEELVEEPEEELGLGDLPVLETDVAIEEPEPEIIKSSEEEQAQDLGIEAIKEEVVEDSGEVYKTEEHIVMPKLADKPTNKDAEVSGKITAIGKLLVDHRDIENIIETNALMQSVGADITSTKIISAVEGGKVNDKLASLKEVEGIGASIVVNDAGFIQASTIDDLQKEQVLGAMASGTFIIISNSINKMGFKPARDVTIESSRGTLALSKMEDKIVSTFIDSGVDLYKLKELNDLLVVAAEKDDKELVDSLASINGVIGAILSDESGKMVASKIIDETKKPESIAEALPAFYSNISVFLSNMSFGELRKAIVNSGNEVILFTSIGSKILLLYANLNTALTSTDVRIQYETIINN